MFDEKSRQVNRLLFMLDILLTVLVFLTSYHLREFLYLRHHADFFPHVAMLPIIVALLGYFLSYFGAYRGLKGTSFFVYSWAITRAFTISFALFFTLLFLLKVQYVSRVFIVMFASLDIIVLATVRSGIVWWYFRKSVEKGENFLKVLIVGTGDRAERVSKALPEHSEWGIDIVGYMDPDPARVGSRVLDRPVIGTVSDIGSVLKNHVIDEVIIAIPRGMIGNVDEIVRACEEEGVRLRLMADMFELHVARMRLVNVGEIPLLTMEPVARDEEKLLVKRLMDLVVTIFLMPLLLPLMGLIAIAIKLDSPGSIFFVQTRFGLKKRLFPMLKFRSMLEGSEHKIKELESQNEAEGPIFKIANDSRITRVGRFLRKSSLDELPQFFNVIRGQMSLVGPRPMSLRDVDLFDSGAQRKRFSVRPGLTCLWQVSGRSNLSFSKWVELDMFYIDNWSLALDLKILLKTIPAVLSGKGAL